MNQKGLAFYLSHFLMNYYNPIVNQLFPATMYYKTLFVISRLKSKCICVHMFQHNIYTFTHNWEQGTYRIDHKQRKKSDCNKVNWFSQSAFLGYKQQTKSYLNENEPQRCILHAISPLHNTQYFFKSFL